MKGMLAGKKLAPYLGHSASEMEAAAAVMEEVVGKRVDGERADAGCNPAQLAIRWVLDNPAITSAVVGIRTMEQLDDAIVAGDGDRLTGEEVQLLQTALKHQRYEEHR
jgi:aryl-alcohol dehydrogenase-like predicted oxidoreductase